MDGERWKSEERRRPPLALLVILTPVKLVLLAAILGGLTFGLVEGGMTVIHAVFGVPVEGRVTHVEEGVRGESYRDVGGSIRPASGPLEYPTISYAWPPDGNATLRVRSAIPRSDLERGDAVTVRIVPGYETLARADRSAVYYGMVVIALVGGALFTWLITSQWYAIEVTFGFRSEGNTSMFSGLAGKVLIFAVGGPTIAALLCHLYFVPWLSLGDYLYVVERPSRLLHLAEERGGPPTDGPLNAYERRLLTIPLLRRGISADSLVRAIHERDTDRLRRYIEAIKDPEIDFFVGSRSAVRLAISEPPDLLRPLLENADRLSAEDRRRVLESATYQDDTEKLAILAELGITPDTVGR